MPGSMLKCQIIKFALLFLVLFTGNFSFAQTDSTYTDSTTLEETVLDSGLFDSTMLEEEWSDSMSEDGNSDSSNFSEGDAMLSDSAFMASIPEQPEPTSEPELLFLESLSMRTISGQTTHTLEKGQLEFCVQHRFGEFSLGKYELYGMDQSRVRIGFDYGITNKITVGVGRSSMGKVFNGFFKAVLGKQGENNKKFSYTWVSDMYVSGEKNTDPSLDPYYFTHRLKYVNQLLVSHAFGQRAVLTLAPTVVHRNLVDSAKYANDLSMAVISGRLKVRKGMNLTSEYSYLFNHDMRKLYTPAFGLGVEFYTSGGHIFQIVFTNSNSMNEADIYAMANGKWSKGQVRMGFNIVRQF